MSAHVVEPPELAGPRPDDEDALPGDVDLQEVTGSRTPPPSRRRTIPWRRSARAPVRTSPGRGRPTTEGSGASRWPPRFPAPWSHVSCDPRSDTLDRTARSVHHGGRRLNDGR